MSTPTPETTRSTPLNEVVISRTFDAPRSLVFKAWTEPERLARWWGPQGCEIEVAKLDLRPGGVFHYAMQMGNAPRIWGIFQYREIVPPERLVFVNGFADEAGDLARNPYIPVWPLEILNTLTLAEQAANRTALTLRGAPINATADELKNFQAQMSGMQQGFAGTFDKLDEYLRSVRA
jgi:uncharacterized protein YndB with AHSA1/START domain